MSDDELLKNLRGHLDEWQGADDDMQPLLDMVGDARVVLIGEASHGTQDFYDVRADLTKRLITEKGFNGVAVEADWPDAYRVNAYVRNQSDDTTAIEALGDFSRFPLWMWRNTSVANFVEWLRDYNTQAQQRDKTGFYGLDLYSLRRSMDEVIKYLDAIDPEAADRARYRYSCFDHYGENPQSYGYAANYGVGQDCENEVVQQLIDMQRQATDYVQRDGRVPDDAFFYAEQNARLAKNAEAYYRSMFQGRATSWNKRDSHMAETLRALTQHLEAHQHHSKIVVWAHNSHLGDARATEMSRRGEHNLGQLARQHFGDDCRNIGFSTFTGRVTAASEWGGEAECKFVRPGLEGSYERLFHEVDVPHFSLNLHDMSLPRLLRDRLQRAIGVIYRPETERQSHYFHARLLNQFDGMIHIDETDALEPLDMNTTWEEGEAVPDTYPFGE
jgi:erythromycin esterase-like protein